MKFNVVGLIASITATFLAKRKGACFPFQGSLGSGCEFASQMCEHSSVTEEPHNPTYCQAFVTATQRAWARCEWDVRLDDGSEFDNDFVTCAERDLPPPPCNGMCALHSGACQILCGSLRTCWSECSTGTHRDRYDLSECVNVCLRNEPTPPPPNETWPSAMRVSFPPGAPEPADLEEYKKKETSIYELQGQIGGLKQECDNLREQLRKMLLNAMKASEAEHLDELEAEEEGILDHAAEIGAEAAEVMREAEQPLEWVPPLLDSSGLDSLIDSLKEDVGELQAERQEMQDMIDRLKSVSPSSTAAPVASSTAAPTASSTAAPSATTTAVPFANHLPKEEFINPS